jgi:multiple sugar transport system substrate-binding protein
LDAAKRFIKYLSDHSLDWAEGGQVPVRRSLRNTPRFEQMTAQREFAKQIPYASYWPPVPYLLELLPEYDYTVELALRGSASAKEALAQCASRIQPVYERYHHPEAAEQQQGGGR